MARTALCECKSTSAICNRFKYEELRIYTLIFAVLGHSGNELDPNIGGRSEEVANKPASNFVLKMPLVDNLSGSTQIGMSFVP
jgi:hypothetical protein